MTKSTFADQRRRRMKALKGKDEMKAPSNASPTKWDAPPDEMKKNGNGNYLLPTNETRRRYNISKD